MLIRVIFCAVVAVVTAQAAWADAWVLSQFTVSEKSVSAADPAYCCKSLCTAAAASYPGCCPGCCRSCTPCSQRCGCGYCDCRPPVANMIGDGGLLQPRILVTGSRSFFMQNHAAKVAENNSAIPMDRIGLHFDTMQNVAVGGTFEGGRVNEDLQEYRLLVEKTLFGPYVSAELIVPIYKTSEYRIVSTESFLVGPQVDAELGDLAFGVKWLMRQTYRSAFSLGLRVEAPTARNPYIGFYDSTITDDVWHFTPYIALQTAPRQRWFVNFFGSYRLNSTTMTSSNSRASYAVREATYLMADASLGYWMFNAPYRRGLTSLAPVVELHYTTTPTAEPSRSLQGISATGWVLGHTDYLNVTAGVTGSWNQRIKFGAGFAFPLRYEDTLVYGPGDRNYRWAFLFNVNYLYGCPRRR